MAYLQSVLKDVLARYRQTLVGHLLDYSRYQVCSFIW
jgi:hypothetical protein